MEFRFRRYDGEYRWILSSGVARFTAGGSFVGYIGSAIDITERKLAEESLTKVSRKFIVAQEEERVRIVDALHGHIDSLILLSTNLDGYEQRNPSSSDVRQEIGEIRQQVKDIVGGILDLSHHLHILKLQYLGLAGAAASFCKELSDRQKVKIDFHSKGVPNELPKEVALSLFRVLQEALQNAIKHSGSQQFEVSLTVRSDRIELTVRDWGIGFDPAAAAKGPGLGLVSMRERLKLVDGDLLIESQPQRGTTVHAGVPLKT
jgi:signal transduction histidine kinase